ncbi:hypothetical protein HZB69_03160 [Candidatus Amesbacteria bacterium]|nr:hypothetical protein [Candidatus Amesbacteria bacterium]
MLDNSSYIKTATASVPLFYPRYKMKPGDKIDGYITNKKLIEGLLNCEYIFLTLYWKPVGDSLLFLSVAQACFEYLQLTRDTQPKWIVDDQYQELIRHIGFLKDADMVFKALDRFKSMIKNNQKAVLITDDDPFKMANVPPIFNSEEYVYPKFVEKDSSIIIKEYSSRPARYFLTFEREVGKRLISDPNNSLPNFVFDSQKTNSGKIMCIVSQASRPEKKFGTTRFIKLAKRLFDSKLVDIVYLLANSKEESPSEWILVRRLLEKYKDWLILVEDKKFEETAELFSKSQIVLGNDTGFTHLAAMSVNNMGRPKVFILYSRHDYSKWSTGKDNVYPIVTKLSEYLKNNNMSIQRDGIDLSKWGSEEWSYSIPINRVENMIKKYAQY